MRAPLGSVTAETGEVAEASVDYPKGKVGTITYDEEDATTNFVDFSRFTPSTASNANGNKTKFERLVAANNHPAGAKFIPFTESYTMTGEAIDVSFDINLQNDKTWVAIAGNTPIVATDHRNNNPGGRIISVGRDTGATLNVYTSTEDATATAVAGTDLAAKWYHIEAVVNASNKEVSLKVYDYKANNNYATATPLYTTSAPVGWRDATLTGVSGIFVASDTNSATVNIDNIYMNDDTFNVPIAVNATDATVSPAFVNTTEDKATTGQEITITPTKKNGQKVTAVKVNGEETGVEPGDSGTYKYTTTGNEESIAVTVEYARNDIDSVTVTGPTTVAMGEDAAATYTYTATVKDVAGYEFTNDDNITVTWELKADDGSGTVSETDATLAQNEDNELQATLSVPSTLSGAKTVKIYAKVQEKVEVPETTKDGELAVKLSQEPVYQVSTDVTPAEGGSVQLDEKNGGTNITEIGQSKTLVVKVTPNDGYEVDTVKYALDSDSETKQDITKQDPDYELDMTSITGNITVYVVFKAKDLTIENSSSDDIEIAVNGTVTTELSKVHVGDKINVYAKANKQITSLTVQDADEGPVENSDNSFTMPAKNVTVSAVTDSWEGQYFTADFNHVTTQATDDSTEYHPFKIAEQNKAFDSTDEGTLKGTWGSTNRQVTINAEEVGSAADMALKFTPGKSTPADKLNRSKSVYSIDTPVSLEKSQSTKMSFDFKMNNTYPMGDDKRTYTEEISFANSENDTLFALRWSREKPQGQTAVDHMLQIYATEPANLNIDKVSYRGEDGVYSNKDAWGSNAFVMTSGLTPAQVQKTEADVVPAADTWYTAEVTFTNTKIDVTIKTKDGGDELGSATFDLTDKKALKRDLKSVIFFHDMGAGGLTGSDTSYISFDNFKAQAGWVE